MTDNTRGADPRDDEDDERDAESLEELAGLVCSGRGVPFPTAPDFRAIAERMAQGTVINHNGGSDNLPRAIDRFEAGLRAMYARGRDGGSRVLPHRSG